MNKRILVVDDTRTMRDFPKNTVYIRHMDDAKEALLNNHWDEVWLDHDMGMAGFGYDVPNGSDLVNWIERIFHEDDIVLDVDTFYVHSANPYGGDRMVMVLDRLGYKVFRKEVYSNKIPHYCTYFGEVN